MEKKINKKIKDLTLDDFIHVIPAKLIEQTLGKRETKHFWNFMAGQTISCLEKQAGIYVVDLVNFLKYRKQGLSGRNMPLDD